MSAGSGKERSAVVSWGPLAAILGTVGIFVFSQIITSLLFGVFFGMANWEDGRVDQWVDSTFGQFLMIAANSVASLGLLWWFLRVKRAGFKILGFLRPPQWRDAAWVIVGFVAYFGLLIAATVIAGQILGINTEQEQEIGFESAKIGGDGLVWVFLSLVVLPPIVEEILFRGFLYGGLRTKLTFRWAVVVTSLLFAVPHLFATSNGFLWIAAVDTFVLSLVLCYMREKTGALWVPIGIHAIKNSLAFLFIFVV